MSKKVAWCAMLTALAMIFSYVEAMIPVNFGIPGIKLGIANLVVVAGLYLLKWHEVLAVSLIRVFLMGFLFGNGVSVWYSLAGGILSFSAMLLVKKLKICSIVGMSIVGGCAHNIGQLLAAAGIIQNLKIFWYLPLLLIAGTMTGTAIGMLSVRIIKTVEKANFFIINS